MNMQCNSYNSVGKIHPTKHVLPGSECSCSLKRDKLWTLPTCESALGTLGSAMTRFQRPQRKEQPRGRLQPWTPCSPGPDALAFA